MQPVTVLFAPAVDAALVELIDYVDVDSVPTVLDFLERIQTRLVQTLSTFPEAGSIFQGEARMFLFRQDLLGGTISGSVDGVDAPS